MKHIFHLHEGDDNTFFASITELLLDLENSFGSPETMEENARQAMSAAIRVEPLQKENYDRFTAFFSDIRQLLRANEAEFYDYKYMLRSYTDGRFLYEEEKNQLHYFDHPYHQEYFKQLNAKPCTETK